MTPSDIGLISILAIVLLIYAGMHVAVALGLASFVGVWLIRGTPEIATNLLAISAADTLATYDFGVIPLFVLMGALVSAADLGRDTYVAANQLFCRVRGGLGIATVAANAVFAAVTGVSIASATVFTKIAVPEMLRLGYKPRFAVGVVAGSSVLGMLIPPSILLIVYGIVSEQSVGKLFLGGVVPGIVLAIMFSVMIYFMATRMPGFVGEPRPPDQSEMLSTLQITKLLGPIVALIVLVIGGIYGGLFTPTEAAAVGALGAFVLAIARRKLTASAFWQLLGETGTVTATICIIFVAASMYSRMLAMSGLPGAVADYVVAAKLGFYTTIGLYLGLVLILGTFLDSFSIILLTVPVMLPILASFNADLIWFGVLMVVAVEVGILTPPLGIAVFTVKSTLNDPRITLNDVFAGAFPFVLVMCVLLVLMLFFPKIVTGIL
ncbi:MAG: TRAP transporter large permease [Burkholderiales bacterium]